MALKPHHAGFGKWKVLDDDGEVVAENLTRTEAFEQAGIPVEPIPGPAVDDSPIPRVGDDGTLLTERERENIYRKRLEAGLKSTDDRLLAPYRAMLLKDYAENTAEYIWKQLEPMLKAGAEGARRELGSNMKVRTAA